MTESRPTEALLPLMQAAFAAGGVFRLWPSGRSMRPLLREGRDSVLLAPLGDPCVGDILLARTEDGAFLLHRAIAVSEEGVLLCGDARSLPEGPLPREAILARAVAVYRGKRALSADSRRFRAYALLARLLRRVRRGMHK
ncbi:MAG: S24/S26 family peptidase [Clostridia bacterium]|nr:S24/S26 family peptidase [Clostridia bacterium]